MKKITAILLSLIIAASAVSAVSAEALRARITSSIGDRMAQYYPEYAAYCVDYLDKYDLNGDGCIDACDFNEAEIRQEEAGEAYSGVRSSELAVFMINASEVYGGRGDYNIDYSLNSKDMATAEVYEQACIRDGVEFPGYTGDAWVNRFGIPLAADKRGDVNGDRKVNARDITALMRIILNGGPKDDSEFRKANVNGDDEINAKDITAVMKIILENK